MRRFEGDSQSGVGVFQEISTLLLKILRSPPPPVPFSDHVLELSSVLASPPRILPASQMTPAGLASLLLGVSVSLMLCGSVTFFVGFVLMPWILVFVTIFYVVGIVSSLSMAGRSLICCFSAPTTHRKHFCAWKQM